ncbi:hypothetical protein CALVIDRAFT_270891 [Calocera viscosa TUFC12733]|uniref:FAD-binding FR-type domain-containing protein n=1 Tax=Calocera viscosa (strain TUFC12733) TaxID=1330018 RepID=A0A167QXA2_CALVF|nr:hypothetical protein CALVIDRAFT_270891 [Calocera viscosa TUFC12733]
MPPPPSPTAHAVPSPPKLRRLPLALGTTVLGLSLASWYFLRPPSPKALDPASYSPALITSHTHPTPRTSLLKLRLPSPSPPPEPFYVLWVKSPQVQIERPYTPLRGLEGEGGEEVELWVRHERGGEVSRYLSGRKVGEEVEVRGWTRSIQWQDKDWDEVIMLSGGTGIAPFHQLLHHLFLSSPVPPQKTRFTLLHGSRSPSELPPPEILGPLAALQQRWPERFRMRLFVDELAGGPAVHSVGDERLLLNERRIQLDDLLRAVDPPPPPRFRFLGRVMALLPPFMSPRQEEKPKRNKVLWLVSGPEEMVEAYAGPRARDLSEGEVGGVLGSMGTGKGWEVRKL